MSQPSAGFDRDERQSRWAALLQQLESEHVDDGSMLEALGRLEAGEQAFPEDLVARGRQIFETVCSVMADRLCTDPSVTAIVSANGPRVSEALTIIPLLFNLLPDQALKEASVALIALLIVRMGIGAFCQRYHRPPPPAAL